MSKLGVQQATLRNNLNYRTNKQTCNKEAQKMHIDIYSLFCSRNGSQILSFISKRHKLGIQCNQH